MSSVRCCKCNKNKRKKSFSKNQLKKHKQRRTCKSCVSKKQNKAAPKKQNNDASKHQNKEGAQSYIASLQNEASILEEPGQLSFLQKLHEHCVGKSVFTEMHLAYDIKEPLLAQVGLQRIFSYFPGAFVYRNIVIIASNCKSEQIDIVASMKQMNTLPFFDSKTRFCRRELLYENGKISSKGIELYRKQNIEHFDIFRLLSNPICDEEKKAFTESSAGKECTKQEERCNELTQLQQKQKYINLEMNKLRREMIEKQSRIKMINDRNTLNTWNTMISYLKKQKDIIFDTDNLKRITGLLSRNLRIKLDIEESDGFNNDLLLSFEKKTFMISHNSKNEAILRIIEDIISYFIQDIESKWNNNDNYNNNEEWDVMLKLINTLKMDIAHHEESIQCREKTFNEYSMKIEEILQNMVQQLQEGMRQHEELWNIEFYPTKLIFNLDGKHEAPLVSIILQKKEVMKQWISQHIDRYEGIGEYGVDHLFIRFINWMVFSQITWWIAVLRWLSLPISITNLNLFRKYVQQSVDEHFMPHRDRFGTEIDVMMVVTYFMHATQKRYQSHPLQFVYRFKKNEKLSIQKEFVWEKEPQITRLCHDCFGYVIHSMANYKQSTTASRMNKQIDIYMSKVTTHVARSSGDNSYQCFSV